MCLLSTSLAGLGLGIPTKTFVVAWSSTQNGLAYLVRKRVVENHLMWAGTGVPPFDSATNLLIKL